MILGWNMVTNAQVNYDSRWRLLRQRARPNHDVLRLYVTVKYVFAMQIDKAAQDLAQYIDNIRPRRARLPDIFIERQAVDEVGHHERAFFSFLGLQDAEVGYFHNVFMA